MPTATKLRRWTTEWAEAEEFLLSLLDAWQEAQWATEGCVEHQGRCAWRVVPYLGDANYTEPLTWTTSREQLDAAVQHQAVYCLVDKHSIVGQVWDIKIGEYVDAPEARGLFRSDRWLWPRCRSMGGTYGSMPVVPQQMAMWLIHLRAAEQEMIEWYHIRPKGR